MAIEQTDGATRQRSLRLWPGVTIVLLQWLGRFGIPWIVPEAELYGAIGALLGGLAIVVWWAFFSRAPRFERWAAIALMIIFLAVNSRLLHVSIATGGMGMMFYILAIPVLCLALVAWAVLSRHLAPGPRRATMVAAILLAGGVWTLLRTDGVSATGSDLAWRWSQTAEPKLLARADDEPVAQAQLLAAAQAEVE